MTALNMLVRNADAVVVHGNTLSLETFGGYQTRRSVFGGDIRTLTAQQASTFLTAAAKALAEQRPAEPSPEPTVTPDIDGQHPPTASDTAEPQPFVVNRKGQMGFKF